MAEGLDRSMGKSPRGEMSTRVDFDKCLSAFHLALNEPIWEAKGNFSGEEALPDTFRQNLSGMIDDLRHLHAALISGDDLASLAFAICHLVCKFPGDLCHVCEPEFRLVGARMRVTDRTTWECPPSCGDVRRTRVRISRHYQFMTRRPRVGELPESRGNWYT
ncbi:hypothetical protein CRG98_019849 [Punica granatum]|uniref:Uncharacterized protein n=1 Tax=Punica granatum TaxID=22663 RepID=A0A2I0JWB2_PUNGR|nr:hypothetical protein CRG98_019849 [Punica granatum]